MPDQAVVDAFHRHYYDAETWLNRTLWLGVPAFKCPFDLWVYQEILFERRPDVIIETGTAHGGSALFLASICDLLKHGRVVTIDTIPWSRPEHPRVTYLVGRSSTDPRAVAEIEASVNPGERAMVILDSDHKAAHVTAELQAYGKLVTPGQYLIVEDTNVNGHPVRLDHGPGPWEAVEAFLAQSAEFEIDRGREKFGLTFNPRGFLRRR